MRARQRAEVPLAADAPALQLRRIDDATLVPVQHDPAAAQVVAGVEGSALHTMVRLRGFAGRVVMVPRRVAGRGIHANHRLVFATAEKPLALAEGLLEARDGEPRLGLRDPPRAAAAIDAA